MRLACSISRHVLRLRGLVCAAAMVAFAAPQAYAAAYVPQSLLDGAAANPSMTVHVIVVAAPGVSTGRLKNEEMKDANGNQLGRVRREYKVVPALSVDLTGRELRYLAQKSTIYSITPDSSVKESSLFSPLELWPLAVNAPALWPRSLSSSGGGPAIAIVDSGVEDGRTDFGGRLDAKENQSSFKSGDSGSDDYGHGTMVAGVAAGAAKTYPGVAPTARLHSVRVINREGRSIVGDILAAADWIFHNRVSKGIVVANFSLRTTHRNYGFFDPINLAAERLWHSGVVVVASAGNNGRERMLYAPASDPFVITVGAVDLNGTEGADDDFNAPWSSHGYTAEGFAKPELAAPGRRIVVPVPRASTLRQRFPDRVVAPGYMWMSGTSFAAPVVAGAALQILARHPTWSPDQVKGALMLTARTLPSAAPLSVGVGEIDVAAAAAVANPPNPNANLYAFVKTDPLGRPYFDASDWRAHVGSHPDWARASWTDASWTDASWTDASWTDASWTDASWTDASWTDASWTDASWTDAAAVE
jgi:serine protease AprX